MTTPQEHGFVSWGIWRWGIWFRVFGYGLHIKPSRSHTPLFSERNGARKAHYILGLRLELLKPLALKEREDEALARLDAVIDSLAQRCAEAEQRLREVEADAARWQWLLENMRTGSLGFGDWWICADEPKAEWIAAIDAEMKNGGQQ